MAEVDLGTDLDLEIPVREDQSSQAAAAVHKEGSQGLDQSLQVAADQILVQIVEDSLEVGSHIVADSLGAGKETRAGLVEGLVAAEDLVGLAATSSGSHVVSASSTRG